MALSGPEAMRSLDDAVRDVRREEDEVGKKLARASELSGKLNEQQAGLFQELASLRLSEPARSELKGQLSANEQRARQMVENHAAELSKTNAETSRLDGEIAAHAKNRRALLAQIDEHQTALKALSGKIAQAMAKDPTYEAKRADLSKLQSVAAESLAKTEQAEADRETKGRPYRDDPLFMYLWECGFGTRNYKANNLVRWLDQIVAQMVGYQNARPNFAMLNEIPLRLREHAERQSAIAKAAEEALDALESAAIDDAGGKPVREALAATQAKIEKIDAEMVQFEDRRDELAAQMQNLASGSDPAFAEATKLLAETLGRQDLTLLLTEAAETSSPADDDLISRIEDIRSRVRDGETEIADHRERLKTLAGRRRELEDLEWEFKKARFDDPRSTFREENLAGDLLNEFLRGAVTASSYWDSWQRSQSWRPGTTDWGGGIGLPRSGRPQRPPLSGVNWPAPPPIQGGGNWGNFGGNSSGSSGGAFSRPRTGSRGTRRSGGFKTGGGF